jgi:hypothetical protein
MESIKKSERFIKRLELSEPFEDDLEAYLIRTGVEIAARTGTERTLSTFASAIRSRNDAVAKQIRFAPDFAAVDEVGVFYAEAKASINIEQGPYENYMHLHSIGARLKLFVRPWPDDKNEKARRLVYWNYIEEVRFVPNEIVVGRWPGNEFPIIHGWICPRSAGRQAGRGSGTPFQEIDLDSMIRIPDFYNDGPVIEVTRDPVLSKPQLDLF